VPLASVAKLFAHDGASTATWLATIARTQHSTDCGLTALYARPSLMFMDVSITPSVTPVASPTR